MDYVKPISNGDPFHVADWGEVTPLHDRCLKELPGISTSYSVKCNTDPKLILHLASIGTGFECASTAEMKLILSLRVSADRIIFANLIKTPQALQFACAYGVIDMTFDNTDELNKIAEHYPTTNLYWKLKAGDPSAPSSLSDKFGASIPAAIQLLAWAKDLQLKIVGLTFHFGFHATNYSIYTDAIR